MSATASKRRRASQPAKPKPTRRARAEEAEEEQASDEEAAAHAAMGKRSYNSMKYWDERYKRHLAAAEAGSDAAAAAAAASASDVSAAPAAAASSTGRKKAAAPKPQAQSKKRARIDAMDEDDVTSTDITSEWYYSYAELSPILRKAFRSVDRSGAVLDIGCGLSHFFLELQRGDERADGGGKASAGAGAGAGVGAGFTGPCIGVDYSPAVVAHLQRAFPKHAHPQITWLCADACHLMDDPAPALEHNATGAHKASKPASKRKSKEAAGEDSSADAAAAPSSAPPPLSPSERALFAPESFSLILDKATSDGMLCSDATAVLTPLLYANVARLLAPGGLFVCISVNEPESGWFGEYVVSQLIEHGGADVQWQIEVHAPSTYSDGEEGAPNVYVIRKQRMPPARSTTAQQREPYTIKTIEY